MPETPLIKRRVVLITGMSGAGLSTALKVFEDLGYEAVDNLRLGLVPTLVDVAPTARRHLAVAIDTRNASFSVEAFLKVDETLSAKPDLQVSLLFLDCSNEKLQQRFTETRRRHPLAVDRPVTDGIKAERELLWKIRNEAEQVIDTSETSIHDLRRLITGHYRFDNSHKLTVYLTSFSYRHGVPREADLVFDTRFLANPHWDLKLRPLTGRDEAVADYIRRDPDFAAYMSHLTGLLLPLLPRFQQEGKSYLTIAVGCSGGRHRSVMVVEELAKIFETNGYAVTTGHRDLDRLPSRA
ncbi:MAG: RNase adapter RapZ [Alphaproteobacteria bacterium]|nr:RNase adapter RapZ [Alphaproteobacteria bacterium]